MSQKFGQPLMYIENTKLQGSKLLKVTANDLTSALVVTFYIIKHYASHLYMARNVIILLFIKIRAITTYMHIGHIRLQFI